MRSRRYVQELQLPEREPCSVRALRLLLIPTWRPLRALAMRDTRARMFAPIGAVSPAQHSGAPAGRPVCADNQVPTAPVLSGSAPLPPQELRSTGAVGAFFTLEPNSQLHTTGATVRHATRQAGGA